MLLEWLLFCFIGVIDEFCLSFCPDPPSKPGKPEPVSTAKNSIGLRWTEPESDGGSPIKGYIVEKKEKGDSRFVTSMYIYETYKTSMYIYETYKTSMLWSIEVEIYLNWWFRKKHGRLQLGFGWELSPNQQTLESNIGTIDSSYNPPVRLEMENILIWAAWNSRWGVPRTFCV